jgi:hypothetical protein
VLALPAWGAPAELLASPAVPAVDPVALAARRHSSPSPSPPLGRRFASFRRDFLFLCTNPSYMSGFERQITNSRLNEA